MPFSQDLKLISIQAPRPGCFLNQALSKLDTLPRTNREFTPEIDGTGRRGPAFFWRCFCCSFQWGHLWVKKRLPHGTSHFLGGWAPRTKTQWLGSPSFKRPFGREMTPGLGDLLTMVFLPLTKLGWSSKFPGPRWGKTCCKEWLQSQSRPRCEDTNTWEWKLLLGWLGSFILLSYTFTKKRLPWQFCEFVTFLILFVGDGWVSEFTWSPFQRFCFFRDLFPTLWG